MASDAGMGIGENISNSLMHAGFESEPALFRNDQPEEIILRGYQDESVAGLRANIRAGIQAQILASMVGSGKTVISAYLLKECWQKGKRGIFVVDRLSLLGQTSAVLDRYGIPHGVIQANHPRRRPGELIQVASVQTLKTRGWPDADLFIFDEAHVLYRAHIRMLEKKRGITIGLTATPFTKGLGKHFGAIVNVTTGNKLTSEGFLVPFKVFAAKEPDMTGAKVVAGEWTDQEASTRATKIIGDVVKEYQKHGQDRKSIIFGVDVAHCEALQRQFLAAGINVSLYTYLTDDEEREMMLREFRKPDSSIRGLISVAALSRGFDVPDVGCIIMCRPLKASFAEFVQILGRGLRSHPEKKDCVILDLAGNFMRHYPRLMEFMEDGVNELDDGKPKPKLPAKKKEKKPVKCPKCAHVFGGGKSCPACGYIFPPKISVQHEDGELMTFDGKKALTLDRAAKIKLHGELTYICEKKGYARGWIAHKYRAITGVWPQGVGGPAIAPSGATLAAVDRLSRMIYSKPKVANVAQPLAYVEADLFG